MKLQIFTIFDSKTQAYLPPSFLQNEEVALRSIRDVLKDPNHQFTKNPEDYSLWQIGLFDDEKGKITATPAPVHIASCHELIEVTDQQFEAATEFGALIGK
ncbi:nonstructural protein [Microviridae sp.]|nr:nonstructural protein [Microviridae sp.]